MAYTDYPENDIRTHRSIAKWNRRLAYPIMAGGCFYYARYESEPWVLAIVFAVTALVLVSAYGMRIQALEWELEELKNDE